MEHQYDSTKQKGEKAVLIGVVTQEQPEERAKEYLEELAFLASTAGAHTEEKFLQSITTPDPKTFIGSGKTEEIKEYVKDHHIDTIIFDDDLSPSQLRNISRIFKKTKVLDRSNLILDIFASRARSAHAKTQVELAQYQYLLPRLTRMWTHLERQSGGIGTRGPGETQIETDRRIIQQKITKLKQKLAKIDKQKKVQRGNRGQLVRAALVGYTNVGKSTLMNRLSKSEVFAENKLFATLDTTVRKVVLGNLPFLMSDTVGFIRKLPHQLVESFKSTLDEVRESDVIVHVLDLAHPNFEEHYKVVNETLSEIDTRNKPTILVFNKLDQYFEQEGSTAIEQEGAKYNLEEIKKTWMNKMAGPDEHCVFVSAWDKTNIQELRDTLYDVVKEIFKIRYPYNDFLY